MAGKGVRGRVAACSDTRPRAAFGTFRRDEKYSLKAESSGEKRKRCGKCSRTTPSVSRKRLTAIRNLNRRTLADARLLVSVDSLSSLFVATGDARIAHLEEGALVTAPWAITDRPYICTRKLCYETNITLSKKDGLRHPFLHHSTISCCTFPSKSFQTNLPSASTIYPCQLPSLGILTEPGFRYRYPSCSSQAGMCVCPWSSTSP